MKILIAEDDITSRSLLKVLLVKHGHEVVETENGAEAWQAMQLPDAPRLAVLDRLMPEIDGLDVCRRIRARETDRPPYIIMLTTKGEKADIVAGLEAGADDYLPKPYDPGELHARVDAGRRLIEMQAMLAGKIDALQKSEERYRILVETASDMVFKTDTDGNFTFVNPAVIGITGYKEEELIGRQYTMMIRPDMRENALKFFGRQMVKGIQNTYSEYPILTKEGVELWFGQNTQLIVKDGEISGFQVVTRDLTERKRMEAEILALSITDQLTGLHNRRGFLSLAEQQLKLAQRNKSGVLLFFADLDGLKWINDTLGHEEGDRALIEAAAVFKETFRTSDIIARLGGDEYAALAVDITEANSGIFTTRLQCLIDTRNHQENRRYRLSISVGCSCYDPEKPCSVDELMASADKLMYGQKQNKKDRMQDCDLPFMDI
jgi:diguanylate cyclase (GGDEF)-like protein/PAS domain S-box-containing protein